MNIQGTIKVINDIIVVSDKFSKRYIVVTTNDQYQQHILIQFTQDKCNVLNSCKVGEQVSVSINLKGKEWINSQGDVKYFNTIEGWKVEKLAEKKKEVNNVNNIKEEDEDLLPF